MKKEFIIKETPSVGIELTRDSVCAGDDMDAPHTKIIKIQSFIDPVILVSNICTAYLPSVDGYGHKWDCLFNGELIAILRNGEIVSKVSEVTYNEKNEMKFRYYSSTY